MTFHDLVKSTDPWEPNRYTCRRCGVSMFRGPRGDWQECMVLQNVLDTRKVSEDCDVEIARRVHSE